MLPSILMYGFSLLVGLAGLGVCAWAVGTGRIFTMDGLALTAISLTVGVIFAGNVAWAFHTGEIGELLEQLRHRPEEAKTPDQTLAHAPATERRR